MKDRYTLLLIMLVAFFSFMLVVLAYRAYTADKYFDTVSQENPMEIAE